MKEDKCRYNIIYDTYNQHGGNIFIAKLGEDSIIQGTFIKVYEDKIAFEFPFEEYQNWISGMVKITDIKEFTLEHLHTHLH